MGLMSNVYPALNFMEKNHSRYHHYKISITDHCQLQIRNTATRGRSSARDMALHGSPMRSTSLNVHFVRRWLFPVNCRSFTLVADSVLVPLTKWCLMRVNSKHCPLLHQRIVFTILTSSPSKSLLVTTSSQGHFSLPHQYESHVPLDNDNTMTIYLFPSSWISVRVIIV